MGTRRICAWSSQSAPGPGGRTFHPLAKGAEVPACPGHGRRHRALASGGLNPPPALLVPRGPGRRLHVTAWMQSTRARRPGPWGEVPCTRQIRSRQARWPGLMTNASGGLNPSDASRKAGHSAGSGFTHQVIQGVRPGSPPGAPSTRSASDRLKGTQALSVQRGGVPEIPSPEETWWIQSR